MIRNNGRILKRKINLTSIKSLPEPNHSNRALFGKSATQNPPLFGPNLLFPCVERTTDWDFVMPKTDLFRHMFLCV